MNDRNVPNLPTMQKPELNSNNLYTQVETFKLLGLLDEVIENLILDKDMLNTDSRFNSIRKIGNSSSRPAAPKDQTIWMLSTYCKNSLEILDKSEHITPQIKASLVEALAGILVSVCSNVDIGSHIVDKIELVLRNNSLISDENTIALLASFNTSAIHIASNPILCYGVDDSLGQLRNLGKVLKEKNTEVRYAYTNWHEYAYVRPQNNKINVDKYKLKTCCFGVNPGFEELHHDSSAIADKPAGYVAYVNQPVTTPGYCEYTEEEFQYPAKGLDDIKNIQRIVALKTGKLGAVIVGIIPYGE